MILVTSLLPGRKGSQGHLRMTGVDAKEDEASYSYTHNEMVLFHAIWLGGNYK
jgi:hypothetical protein